jgi:2-polyprenyl-3-methyl-5-hydroxy-6-metoxy-1,4-benzoquinol methylase
MGKPTAAQETVKRTLQHAESFYRRHQAEKAVQTTFGYFTHHPVAPLNEMRLQALLDILEEHSQELRRPLRVLDLACGGGLIACAIAALGHKTLGLDLSCNEIEMAWSFAREEDLRGKFEQADLLESPDWEGQAEQVLGGKPDAVALAYALHHFPRVESFLQRLSAWLDPGTILIVNEENPQSPLFRLKHTVRTWIQKDTDVEASPISRMEKLARIDGLSGGRRASGPGRRSPALVAFFRNAAGHSFSLPKKSEVIS